jgi:peptidoglycan/xylan/chitin deacetylase (PgdA/CDA1 family)
LREQPERSGAASRRGAFVRAACATGIVSGWRFARRYSIPILAYHGISRGTGGAWSPLRQQVSPQEFETHLRVLARHYQFVSLDTAVGVLAGRLPARPNCIAVTFDDGYRNNLTEALPLLARYAAPATVFLPVGNIEARQPLWFDRLDFALQHLSGPPFSVRIEAQEFRFEPNDRASLQRVFAAIRDHVKRALSDADLRATMASLAEELEERTGRRLASVFEADPHCGLMNWDDVRANGGGLFAFESHTVDHVRLTRVEEYEARDQLARSR